MLCFEDTGAITHITQILYRYIAVLTQCCLYEISGDTVYVLSSICSKKQRKRLRVAENSGSKRKENHKREIAKRKENQKRCRGNAIQSSALDMVVVLLS